MSFAAVASAGIGLVGGALNKKAGDKNAKAAQDMSEADRAFNREQAQIGAIYNRPNQSNPWGSSEWTVDPVTGKSSQNVSLHGAEQSRLDDFRQIAANRMRSAGNIGFSEGPINYEGMGLGHIANMAGFGSGTSGQRPPMPTYGRGGGAGGGGMMQRPPQGGMGGPPQGGMSGPPQGGMGGPPQTPRYASQQQPAPVISEANQAPIAPAVETQPQIETSDMAKQIADLLRWQAEQQTEQERLRAEEAQRWAGQGGD